MTVTVYGAFISPEFIYSGNTYNLMYSWSGTGLPKDYKVFVHFVEVATGVTRFQSDHFPPTPTSQWNGVVQYFKTVAVPTLRPNGKYKMLVGLYEPGVGRIPLDCGAGVTHEGSYRYKVGEFYLSGEETSDFQPVYEVAPGEDVQAALNGVAAGGTLIFKPGLYEHANVLKLENAENVCIKGFGAELRSTVAKKQSFWINACHDVLVRGLIHSSTATVREQNDLSSAVLVYESAEVTILENHVKGSAGPGIHFTNNSRDFYILNCVVENTLADGVHITSKCSGGTIVDNTFRNTGDDCIGLIGYVKQGGVVSDMVVEGNTMENNNHGRGIGIEGAHDVTIAYNKINLTNSAGVIVGSNKTYNTHGCKNVTIVDNKFYGCNTSLTTQHGCIFVNGREGVDDGTGLSLQGENVVISSNQIEETVSGSAHIRVNQYNSGVGVVDNVIIDADSSKKAIVIAPQLDSSQYTVSGNTYNGSNI